MFNLQASFAATTAVFPQHAHCVMVDASGNGQTSNDAGHAHAVIAGAVQPNARDGHTHAIVNQACRQAQAQVPPAGGWTQGMAGAPTIQRSSGGGTCGSCGQKKQQ